MTDTTQKMFVDAPPHGLRFYSGRLRSRVFRPEESLLVRRAAEAAIATAANDVRLGDFGIHALAGGVESWAAVTEIEVVTNEATGHRLQA
jgi:hypothetical protein